MFGLVQADLGGAETPGANLPGRLDDEDALQGAECCGAAVVGVQQSPGLAAGHVVPAVVGGEAGENSEGQAFLGDLAAIAEQGQRLPEEGEGRGVPGVDAGGEPPQQQIGDGGQMRGTQGG
ncbi:hypothetical protein ACIRQH_39730 [Streptomyces sp. NPDC102279]|uniref:hypothetical protein n=1 Tax=Streptomyces sp. NPDC102279 TaxID=3366153 RepID=UPI0038040512